MLRGWVAHPRFARTLQGTESSKSFSISTSNKPLIPLGSAFYTFQTIVNISKNSSSKGPTKFMHITIWTSAVLSFQIKTNAIADFLIKTNAISEG